MTRGISAGLAVILVLPAVFIGAALAVLAPTAGTFGTWGGLPEALDDIPAEFLALYRQAAGRFGIPVQVLAAVGKVECDHGRNPACARPNPAGAQGPMQFLPDTFAAYGWASGSPNPSPYDPRDAVFAAAACLAASGLPADPARAIFAYNHARWYVALVVAWALAYGWTPSDTALLADAVLAHPNLDLRPDAAGDVASGRIDSRVLAVLLILATTHRLGAIGPLITGHSLYVAGTTTVSNHVLGRAVDLPLIDGQPVSPANTAAFAIVKTVAALPETLRPSEVGSPWDLGYPGHFTDRSHQRHLHLGYDRNAT